MRTGFWETEDTIMSASLAQKLESHRWSRVEACTESITPTSVYQNLRADALELCCIKVFTDHVDSDQAPGRVATALISVHR